jgi:hypothetical protein
MARIVTGDENESVHVTWLSSGKQELSEGVRAWLLRELIDEERRRFHLALE